MAPVLTFVSALATIVAASGITVRSAEMATTGRNSLRGEGRKLQEGFCNFIGCPNGFIPIPDAMNVECNNDPCEASQCCEAFCSFHPCPNNFIPVMDAAIIMCEDSGCTDELCCVSGLDMGPDDDMSFNFDDGDDNLFNF